MVEKVTNTVSLTIAHSHSGENTGSKLSSGKINETKPPISLFLIST